MSVGDDLRYGARMLWRDRGLTFSAVLALALGIGANTAIFSVVNGILLRPLPYPDSDQLVRVYGGRGAAPHGAMSAPDFLDLKDQGQSFQALAAYREGNFILVGTGEPQNVQGLLVSPTFFQVFAVNPVRGRTFSTTDRQASNEQLIVVGYNFWQRRSGGDPDLVGKSLTLNGESYVVVGIMPPDFKYPDEQTEVWALPEGQVPNFLILGRSDLFEQRGAHYLSMVGRLKSTVAVETARAEITTIATRLAEQYPDTNADRTVGLVPLLEDTVGEVRPALLIILGAVALVLLIACVNVANLLLARSTARQKEIAIRTALGAARPRLMRQFLTESTLLGLLGGALGLVLAYWGLNLLIGLLPEDLPRLADIRLDRTVLAFTFGVAVATGLFFGLAPALQASLLDVNASLREGGRSGVHPGRQLARHVLVVSQIGLALVLASASGLLIRSFLTLQQVDPGFHIDGIVTTSLGLPQVSYGQGRQQLDFVQRLYDKLGALPGSVPFAIAVPLPLTRNDIAGSFLIDGRPTPQPADQPRARLSATTPNLFRTLGIPVLKGRDFDEAELREPRNVVIVSQAAAREYWPEEDPLGRRIAMGDTPGEEPWLTIVGVVGDVRPDGLDVAPTPFLYFPFSQLPFPYITIAVQTTTPEIHIAAVRQAVHAVDPGLPLDDFKTMQQLLARSVAARRLNMVLLGLFAAVALVLAAIGVYGVISYSVTQRAREIGVRMALGAERRNVLALVVRHASGLALVGVLVGLAGALATGRLLSSLLYGVGPYDPVTLTSVSCLLMGVALMASYFPARRATRIDPIRVLKAE